MVRTSSMDNTTIKINNTEEHTHSIIINIIKATASNRASIRVMVDSNNSNNNLNSLEYL